MAGTEREAATVLDAVRAIVPTLRENGKEGEDQRWISEQNLELLEKADVFRTGVPKRFGGLELSVPQHIDLLLEISRGCGSTGWVCEGFITAAWMVRLFPERAQQEVYAGGSARVSGGFTPSGTLVPTEGGYLLNGAWRFNTGCRGADWNLAATNLHHPDGTVQQMLTVVPIGDITFDDDWDTMAAAATGSSTTFATDVFIPAHRAIDMGEAFAAGGGEPTGPGEGRDYGLISVVMAESTSTLIGMAQGAYDLFLERVHRPLSYTAWQDQAEHPLTQIQVATAANQLAAARALLAAQAGIVQERADAGERLTTEERATLRGQCGFAVKLAREATQTLFAASGASAIQRSLPIQRFFRDVQGFSMHAVMTPDANLEVYGRVLLGLDPNTTVL
ncbi:acyl-CoA dehydrogenase [Streptomyces sp. MP131-18]|uniref:acyl-CoA dehydrogenase n=1 Tax=Streptomyces sp. MP131-18 TaxID=1857892 RepID=UPI00097C8F15|nr:acyl-CoA dehydrogenase [Streptomyces sp. MP131-18]ONK09809.1 Flavin-dependent monooxygenase, oxygenase subunit HsaA [Streptomyces sp. MP131-18]